MFAILKFYGLLIDHKILRLHQILKFYGLLIDHKILRLPQILNFYGLLIDHKILRFDVCNLKDLWSIYNIFYNILY